jgi:serine/threonine-protein kinase
MPDPKRQRPSSPLPTARRLRTRVWTLGRLLVLAVALSVTFGLFFLTGMRVANRAREVTVPDLAGLDAEQAKQVLEDTGLVMRIEARRPDGRVAANRVLDQEPSAGSILRRQRAVRVRVSLGRQDPVVPDVIGQIERTAEIVLADDKIAIAHRSEIRTSAYSPGLIVGQDPPATGQSSSVSLLVNRGQAAAGYVMPDVIGAIASRTVDLLRRRGFRVTVGAEVPYPGLPSGVVVRQTPQAGFRVGEGDPIVIEVSR